jgi:hypothetical protein
MMDDDMILRAIQFSGETALMGWMDMATRIVWQVLLSLLLCLPAIPWDGAIEI